MDHTTYDDHKYCPTCKGYVPYLQSIELAYCVQCGDAVRLFSDEDWSRFQQRLSDRRPKGGRPKKKRQAVTS